MRGRQRERERAREVVEREKLIEGKSILGGKHAQRG